MELAHDWTDQPAPDKPSKLAEVAETLGAVVGSAMARSIMASLSADKSHASRVANGLTDELQGAQNPILGILQGGKRGKGAAIARLGQMILPMLSGKMGQGNHGDGSRGSSPKSFTL
jgi:phage-related protein